jgi:hypothetical protein
MLPRERAPVIRFLCRPEDYQVIAEPTRATASNWIREPPAAAGPRASGLGAALSMGWILPLAATVRLTIENGGRTIQASSDSNRVLVSRQDVGQSAGSSARFVWRFHNYWLIQTPPGWSCVFLPSSGGARQPFECSAGVVETDSYAAHIHFPFVVTAPDGIYTIERGTPLVQVIPFRRSATFLDSEIRAETAAETERRQRLLRRTFVDESWKSWWRAARRPGPEAFDPSQARVVLSGFFPVMGVMNLQSRSEKPRYSAARDRAEIPRRAHAPCGRCTTFRAQHDAVRVGPVTDIRTRYLELQQFAPDLTAF